MSPHQGRHGFSRGIHAQPNAAARHLSQVPIQRHTRLAQHAEVFCRAFPRHRPQRLADRVTRRQHVIGHRHRRLDLGTGLDRGPLLRQLHVHGRRRTAPLADRDRHLGHVQQHIQQRRILHQANHRALNRRDLRIIRHRRRGLQRRYRRRLGAAAAKRTTGAVTAEVALQAADPGQQAVGERARAIHQRRHQAVEIGAQGSTGAEELQRKAHGPRQRRAHGAGALPGQINWGHSRVEATLDRAQQARRLGRQHSTGVRRLHREFQHAVDKHQVEARHAQLVTRMGQLTLPGGDGETPEPRMHQLTRAGLIQCGQQPVALREEVIPGDKAGELVLPRAPPQVFDKGLIALRELM
ncbi:hypothetical protein D3C87_1352110 [compost metagenome]